MSKIHDPQAEATLEKILNRHPGDVFSFEAKDLILLQSAWFDPDSESTGSVRMRPDLPTTGELKLILRSLVKQGRAARCSVDGTTFFGCNGAIAKLKGE
jgi:hypothetical protein